MRSFALVIAFACLLAPPPALADAPTTPRGTTTLQSAFDAARPGEGYDRLVILAPDTLYTGGVVVSGVSACLHGRGAGIDLGGDGEILVTGGSGTLLDLDHCVIVNGANGVHYDSSEEPGAIRGRIVNNTFAGNGIAIRAFQTDPVNTLIENNIIAYSNAAWGVYVRDTYEPVIQWNDVWGIRGYEYMKQCG